MFRILVEGQLTVGSTIYYKINSLHVKVGSRNLKNKIGQ